MINVRKIFGTTKEPTINWKQLTSENAIQEIISESADKPILIFKHSTRCSISSMAKSRLENKWNAEETNVTPYYLDLIAYRDLSDKIAQIFGVHHESPQILMIKDGKCHYDTSHMDISFDAVKEGELNS